MIESELKTVNSGMYMIIGDFDNNKIQDLLTIVR